MGCWSSRQLPEELSAPTKVPAASHECQASQARGQTAVVGNRTAKLLPQMLADVERSASTSVEARGESTVHAASDDMFVSLESTPGAEDSPEDSRTKDRRRRTVKSTKSRTGCHLRMVVPPERPASLKESETMLQQENGGQESMDLLACLPAKSMQRSMPATSMQRSMPTKSMR